MSQDPQVKLEREDQPVTVAQLVWMVLLAPVVLMAQRVHVDLQDQKVDRELKVPQDHQDHQAHKEPCKDSHTGHIQTPLSVKTRDLANTSMEMTLIEISRTRNQKSWLPS
ncbi:hypothetical protein, partial [Salmonella sp. s54395]|uniref:hypothetical protein n=1 Tax=Salmonella sp. s54395 TaxID=3159664 RepID=UPI00398014AF